MQWTWNDGWLLMAVHTAASDKGCHLWEIIAAADVTNHAIPTADEMSEALSKLASAGVIDLIQGRYFVTEQYAEGVKAARAKRGGLFETGRKGHDWLKKS